MLHGKVQPHISSLSNQAKGTDIKTIHQSPFAPHPFPFRVAEIGLFFGFDIVPYLIRVRGIIIKLPSIRKDFTLALKYRRKIYQLRMYQPILILNKRLEQEMVHIRRVGQSSMLMPYTCQKNYLFHILSMRLFGECHYTSN